MAAGLVHIKHDGTIHVASPPAAAADPRKLTTNPLAGATQVQLIELTKKLGITPVVARTESAYAPTTGSADPC